MSEKSAEKDARSKCREGIAPAGYLCLDTGCHDADFCVVRPACNWTACRRTKRADGKCFSWCKCRCHSRVIPSDESGASAVSWALAAAVVYLGFLSMLAAMDAVGWL